MAKPALGKGLGALISTHNTSDNITTQQHGDVVMHLVPEVIVPSPLQPRATFTTEQLEELTASIKEHGIIQPLIVRVVNSKYELIAGERRWRAASALGLTTVPAIVREATDQDVLELALIENLQRANLSPMEEAHGYARLQAEFHLKQADIAKRVGKSRAAVTNSIRLLALPQDVLQMIHNSLLSVGHAKVLLGLNNPGLQLKLAIDIVKRGYTVRKTEKMIEALRSAPTATPSAPIIPSELCEKATQSLSYQLKTHATINVSQNGEKGTIKLPFESQNELVRLLKALGLVKGSDF